MSQDHGSRVETEDDPFLMQIAAEPDNETAKRIYADWLEERGDERAELIRIHLKLSKLPTRHQTTGRSTNNESNCASEAA